MEKSKKNKGGRPRKFEHEKARNKVSFVINDDDMGLLEKRMKYTGLSKSFIVKNALLKDLKKEHEEPRQFSKSEVKFMNEISRLGNVLNQIARKLNSDLNLSVAERMNLLDSINQLKSELYNMKSN